MKEFKLRASATSNLMGIKGMGKTGESYLQTWVKEQLYGKRKEFSSKYTQKGNENEDEAIDIIAESLGFDMLVKNEEYFENEFICGTPDVITKDLIIDAKSSWDCFTLPLFETKLNHTYYWQMQSYMALTGKQSAKVVYALTDTPLHLIQKEAYWWCKENGYEDLDLTVYNEFVEKHTYNDVPDNLKIKTFEVERNEKDIELIYSRVKEAREYINNLIK